MVCKIKKKIPQIPSIEERKRTRKIKRAANNFYSANQ